MSRAKMTDAERAASRRKAAKKGKVTKRTNEIMKDYETLGASQRMMVQSMVRTFAWYEVSCDDLMEQIDREGMLVGTEKGKKENPALAVLHKTAARKQEYFTKIMTTVRRAESDASDDLGGFDEFVG